MSRTGRWMACIVAAGVSLGIASTGCRPTVEYASGSGGAGESTGGLGGTGEPTGGSLGPGGQGGEAPCGPGTTECAGACVDTEVDPANCGACGNVCGSAHATASCSAGTCAFDCDLGFADCNGDDVDGCEAHTADDAKNCGKCGSTCAGGVVCIGGACDVDCEAATIGHCALGAADDGTSVMGSCVDGYSGTCSFVCIDAVWNGVTSTCEKVVPTLDFQDEHGYLLSNMACGGDCNIGSTDQQQADFVCVEAGGTTALSYVVEVANFYPCWCVGDANHIVDDCCGDGGGLSWMITSIICQ